MKAITRSSLRLIRSSLHRFLSIFGIIALGVGFFAGLQASQPDMLLSAETYFREQNMADFRLISTYGFDEKDLAALETLPNVHVYPSDYADCLVRTNDSDVLARMTPLSASEEINLPVLQSGRLPQAPDECIALAESIHSSLGLGDTFTLTDESLGAQVTPRVYTVVGTFSSPLYIDDFSHGSTTVGDGSLDAILYLPAENFSSDDATQVYLTFDDLAQLGGYSDAYTAARDALQGQIEGLADQRESARLEEIRAEAMEEVREAESRISEGEQELADADAALRESKRQLDAAARQLAGAQEELSRGEAALTEQETTLKTAVAEGQAQLNQAEEEYHAGLAQYEAGILEYEGQKATLTQSAAALAEAKSQLDRLAALTGTEHPMYQAALAEYEAQTARLTEGEAELAQAAQALEETRLRLEAAQSELQAGREQLSAQQSAGEAQLAAARAALESGRREYQAGQAAYEKNRRAYEAGLAGYRAKEPGARAELEDAGQEVREARQELEELPAPVWYCYSRADFPGYTDYADNAARVGNIAKLFPAFFLLVAVLVCLTAMTRLVDEERTQIGALRALGYGTGAVLRRYLCYALSATAAGAVLGEIIGFQVFPQIIMNAYSILYQIPVRRSPFRLGIGAAALAASCLAVTLTVVLVCRAECRQEPAKLLRPKAPASGKRVLLERIGPVWRRLGFFGKVTGRNLFRYKKRMCMALIGIAGCTALTLTGFGLKDSIGVIVENQYNRVWHYQAMAAYSEDSDGALDRIRQTLEEYQPDGEAIGIYQKIYNAQGVTGKRPEAYLVVPEDAARFGQFVSLSPRTQEDAFPLTDSGVLITEKLARLLGLGRGDSITLQSDGADDLTVTVEGVTENYVSHYIFCSEALYRELTGEAPAYNLAYLQYDPQAFDENKLSASLLEQEGVLQTILLTGNREGFQHMISALNLIVVVLIICAGGLALIVLYNLNSINITERIRELSTLKVLGFFDREVTGYIFRETAALSVLGGLLGLILGRFLTFFVVKTAEIDLVMFGREIFPRSYLIAFAVTAVFTLLVSLILHRVLQKINMVDALKSVE